MDIDYAFFPQRLEIAMKLAGLSRQALAKKSGVSAKSIENYLKGKRPAKGQPHKLASACNVDIVWFLTGEGIPRMPLHNDLHLSDREELYARMEEKEAEGVRHSIALYGPKAIAVPDVQETIGTLVKMVEQRDKRIADLEAQIDSLYSKIKENSRSPEDEQRRMNKELLAAFNGNKFLKRRSPP